MSINTFKKIAGSIVLLVIIGGLCYCGFRVINALTEKGALPTPKTIEEIAKVNFDDIDHIQTSYNIFNPDEFRNLFRSNYYEAFSGDIDLRRGEIYRCYNSDDDLLFTLKNYPQESVIELSFNGEISLYKKASPSAKANDTQ